MSAKFPSGGEQDLFSSKSIITQTQPTSTFKGNNFVTRQDMQLEMCPWDTVAPAIAKFVIIGNFH